MTILQGTMQDGTVLPVQVDAQGRLVAQLAATALVGTRNVIINGDLKVNQRGVTIAAAAVGAYGPDRWKKVDASNMTQIIEDLNFVPGAKYTLSWKGGTPQVLTAPASGHWTLPNIPITATEVQLELGEVATPFERRSYGQELALCQRYYAKTFDQSRAPANFTNDYAGVLVNMTASTEFTGNTAVNWRYPTAMRATPTIAAFTPYSGTAFTGCFSDSSNVVIAASAAQIGTAAAMLYPTGGALSANAYAYIHATASAEL